MKSAKRSKPRKKSPKRRLKKNPLNSVKTLRRFQGNEQTIT
jgi:hypothetical protein